MCLKPAIQLLQPPLLGKSISKQRVPYCCPSVAAHFHLNTCVKYTWAIINGHGLTFALLLYIYNHN
jgi:hypothetical protein